MPDRAESQIFPDEALGNKAGFGNFQGTVKRRARTDRPTDALPELAEKRQPSQRARD